MMAWRLVAVAVLWLSYVVSFPWLFTVFGSDASLFALIPIAASSWAGALRGGIASAIAATLILSGQLYYVLDESAAQLLAELRSHYDDPLWFLLMGAITGKLVDLQRELKTYKRATSEAQYDPLTGLLNRSSFVERLNKIMMLSDRKEMLAGVLFVDLDKFKYVNDTYGHDIGDELLKQVARVLKQSVRQDDIVARLGGDEFMLVLSQLKDPAAATVVAGKIVKTLNTPFKIHGKDINIGASVGISIYPDDGATAEELVKAADTAMYSVKASGKNRYELKTSEARAKEARRQDFEKQLQFGFDNREFELFFQPQVVLKTRKLRGFEVFLRWRSKELGLVTPAEFLPLAETAGLLQPLDHWALRESCHQLATWYRAGYKPVKLAVNISAIQFNQPDFVQRVEKALKDYDLNPAWLELELTEAALAGDSEGALKKLQVLAKLGVSLTLDNFGSGYTSIEVLTRLPVKLLKIDKRFTRKLNSSALKVTQGSSPDRRVVEAICALGQKLGRHVMAEGIETSTQNTIITELGCVMGQGYYYAKPMNAGAAQKHLSKLEPAAKPGGAIATA